MNNDIQSVRSQLLDIFAQNGIIVADSALQEDVDLRMSIEDSVQFISAIVEIENHFDIELPEELLLYESVASFMGFSQSIWQILHNKK